MSYETLYDQFATGKISRAEFEKRHAQNWDAAQKNARTYEQLKEDDQRRIDDDNRRLAQLVEDRNAAKRRNDAAAYDAQQREAQARRDRENGFS